MILTNWQAQTLAELARWRRERRAFGAHKNRQAQARALKGDVTRHRRAVDRAVITLHAARFFAFGEADSKRISRRIETLADEIRRGLDTYAALPYQPDKRVRPARFDAIAACRQQVVECYDVTAADVGRFLAARLSPAERAALCPRVRVPGGDITRIANQLIRRLQRKAPR